MFLFISDKEVLDSSSVVSSKLDGETLYLTLITGDKITYSGGQAFKVFGQLKKYYQEENAIETQSRDMFARDYKERTEGGRFNQGDEEFS